MLNEQQLLRLAMQYNPDSVISELGGQGNDGGVPPIQQFAMPAQGGGAELPTPGTAPNALDREDGGDMAPQVQAPGTSFAQIMNPQASNPAGNPLNAKDAMALASMMPKQQQPHFMGGNYQKPAAVTVHIPDVSGLLQNLKGGGASTAPTIGSLLGVR